jgi:thioredoxin 1
MGKGITALSDATFDEHVKAADTPVLVDFWAEWCGPCKMIAPVLEEISGEQAGKIEIAKLNIDENLDVTRRYEVMSVPTMILFKDGEPQARIVGARGKAQLLQELAAYL